MINAYIVWRNLATNHYGCGTVPLPLSLAEKYVAELNETYAGVIEHWVYVPDTGEENE